ncbi:hypothetical protein QCA50_000056 [Cerrena zonata]|uniref:N-acetyltransferase domain-containing protein n=1 Tax=Cerrena zonata TaxID=2478898 RepID=A0AAW0GVR4_9APHY
MSSTNPSQLFIRPARRSDSGALSRICLLTGDAGASAEDLHTFRELIGVMYAEPYVHLPFAGGFVLVDPSKKSLANNFESNDNHDVDEGKGGKDEDEGSVVGYILSAFDTIQFEKAMEEEWLPKYRSQYPLSITSPDSPSHASSPPPKDADIRFIKTIHDPHHAHPAALAYSPAHMHIDILAEYQRLGYGKKLIGVLVKWLKDEKGLDRMWLGMDTRNVGARRFYEKLGFREIVGAPLGVVGIEFQDWKD